MPQGMLRIYAIKWAAPRGYRPMLSATTEALGTLAGVALSSPIAIVLYLYMLLP